MTLRQVELVSIVSLTSGMSANLTKLPKSFPPTLKHINVTIKMLLSNQMNVFNPFDAVIFICKVGTVLPYKKILNPHRQVKFF